MNYYPPPSDEERAAIKRWSEEFQALRQAAPLAPVQQPA